MGQPTMGIHKIKIADKNELITHTTLKKDKCA